jgi:Skp family chaperone for outer membrane proteins
MKPLIEDGSRAIQAVMARRNMTVLIELDSVYHGGTDITEEVISRLKQTVSR